MTIDVVQADYRNPQHAADIGYLINCYARDPMGGGAALPGELSETLAAKLAELPHAFSFICYVDNEPAGICNCFENFSTFAGKPLINIHDIAVVKKFRGRGLSRLLLKAVENLAQQRGCCKLTLEVLEGNRVARQAYQNFGFSGYQLEPEKGCALFWEKPLPPQKPQ